jgi:hypothetical protein
MLRIAAALIKRCAGFGVFGVVFRSWTIGHGSVRSSSTIVAFSWLPHGRDVLRTD